ncbi:hypothetical protein [Mucilaginibacter polytrichastri]|uniref:hypothetical protein n=1 Tax=Mucilaginibacter polytrichastri TaxID=1302689 RepID=UPI000945DB19|nr:hypothetical protein [Mucilaginibacter polytrichastri]
MFLITSALHAQTILKRDTVYYLIDTASVPKNDRMFVVGQEGSIYGYRLTCQCYPWQTDPVFYRRALSKGIISSNIQDIKLATLRSLISIAVKFGMDEKNEHVYFFIERLNEKLIRYEVSLAKPWRQDKSIDMISVDTTKRNH